MENPKMMRNPTIAETSNLAQHWNKNVWGYSGVRKALQGSSPKNPGNEEPAPEIWSAIPILKNQKTVS